MSQVFEPEPIEEQHGFFKQYVKIAGRKARCALCHGKILVDAAYSINNGLICHDTCIEETKNLDNNVRRRTLKLMGIGAVFAGATAIGASRLASASGVQQTQITANGVILPSLTSDPANPEPGQMWYRSDAGVIAHFDAIENRVIYSNRIVDGSAVVSAKGIANGLSVLPNDGQDWGPDTMLGATAPGQYGSPYTNTTGIWEAYNSLPLVYDAYTGEKVPTGTIRFIDNSGLGFSIYEPLILNPFSRIALIGGNAPISTVGGSSSSTGSGGTSPIHITGYYVPSANSDIAMFGAGPIPSGHALGNGSILISNIEFVQANTLTNGGIIVNNYNFETEILDNVIINYNGSQTTGVTLYQTVSSGGNETSISTIYLFARNANQLRFMNINGFHVHIGFIHLWAQNNTSPSDAIEINNNFDELVIECIDVGGSNSIGPLIGDSASNSGNVANILTIGIDAPLITNQPVIYCTNTKFHIGSVFLNGSAGQPWVSQYRGGTGWIKIDKIENTNYAPSLAANPPVTATVYQNTNPTDIEIDLPVYATTAGTAGYVTIAKGPTSTPTAIGNQYVNGATSSTSTDIIKLRVPAGWYYSFTASGVTFGTASVFAD